jgi:hypothetical protein
MTTEQRIEKIEQELEKLKKFVPKELTWTKIGDLEWGENLGKMSWTDAMAKAKELGARLPNRWEILKAIEENKEEMEELVKDDDSNYFWSASENSSTYAWGVFLSFGATYNVNKTNAYHVRCVR